MLPAILFLHPACWHVLGVPGELDGDDEECSLAHASSSDYQKWKSH